ENGAIELDLAFFDGNADKVAADAPGLPSPLGENVAAYDLVIGGRRARFGQGAKKGAHQIGAADDADDVARINDGHVLDVVGYHQLDDLGERGARRGRNDAGCHYLVHPAAMRMNILAGHLAGTDKKFEPARPYPPGAKFRSAQEIAFADDTGQRSI